MAPNEAVVCISQATQPVADPHLGDDQEGCHQPCQAQGKGCRVQRLDPFWCCFGQWENHNGDPHRLIVAHFMNHLEEISVLVTYVPYQAERTAQTCKRFALLYTALEREALEQGEDAPSAGAPGVHCSGSWLPMRLAGHNRGQERRSQQPFPSLTELDPEISGFHC